MIPNRYSGKCSCCNVRLEEGEGFAYKNGTKWSQVCTSAACHRKLGLTEQKPKSQERKLLADGHIVMGYDAGALPFLRSMPGAKWDASSKQWIVSTHPKDLPRVLEIAQKINLDIDPKLKALENAGTEESRTALKRADRLRVDGKTLFPFQKEGVKFLALHDRALLADEMGTGKTVQSLVALPENDAIIILCPASVKYNWRDEIKMWRPEFSVQICEGRDSFVIPEKGQVVICNYDILPAYLLPKEDPENPSGKKSMLTEDQIQKLNACTLIADECHLCKNYKSQRGQKVKELSKNVKCVWFLTGTPLLNRPTDLYGVLEAGHMNALGSWAKFVQLFNGFKNVYGGYEFGMPSEEVPERMKRIMLRRLRSDVLKDLPPKTYQRIQVDGLSKELIARLNDFVIASAVREGLIDKEDVTSKLIKNKEMVEELASKLEMTELPDFKEFSEIRALLAEARIPAMLEEVQSYEESDTPLIVFSAHRLPILELGKREGWKIITGDTKPEERRNIVHEFQEGKLKGVGLTIAAGGVGLTLTHASNVLFVDLDWVPANNLQAEDRACRIGQEANKVLIKRMSSSHPLDQHMQELLEYKIELAYKALEGMLTYKSTANKPKEIKLREESDEELMERIKGTRLSLGKDFYQRKLSKILDRERSKVEEPEPELSVERKEMLREALGFMAGRCDGAQRKDGQGFNKPDAVIGHWLYQTGLDDSDEVSFRVLERMLVRYKRQLKGRFEGIWK